MSFFKGRNDKKEKCGGTSAFYDKNAPKVIASSDMTLFQATSVLPSYRDTESTDRTEPPGFVSAFAARSGDGTFLFLEKGDGYFRRGVRKKEWAYVKEDIFSSLVKIVIEYDIAKSNGLHSTTHGLPENFGGSVDIRYASGERICFSNNQSPVLSFAAGMAIAGVFDAALKGKRITLPGAETLEAVRFEEDRKGGGFTRAFLTLEADGTGVNKKESRYDDPTVYTSQKTVSAETVNFIKERIESSGILAWQGLPDNGFSFNGDKKLTFIFNTGEEITVEYGKILPPQIDGAFFDIELEMTTKN